MQSIIHQLYLSHRTPTLHTLADKQKHVLYAHRGDDPAPQSPITAWASKLLCHSGGEMEHDRTDCMANKNMTSKQIKSNFQAQ